MARRMAAALALVVFAVCVIAGLNAGNSFETVLTKALLAMAGTFAVGLVVGAMAQKMLDEGLATEPGKPGPDAGPAAGSKGEKEKSSSAGGNPERNPGPRGR